MYRTFKFYQNRFSKIILTYRNRLFTVMLLKSQSFSSLPSWQSCLGIENYLLSLIMTENNLIVPFCSLIKYSTTNQNHPQPLEKNTDYHTQFVSNKILEFLNNNRSCHRYDGLGKAFTKYFI